MKLRYVGLPNHTMHELVAAGVINIAEPLEIGKVYDIPSDDPELIRKLNVLVKSKNWEYVKEYKKENKK